MTELLLEHELGKTLLDALRQAGDELHTSVEETVESKQRHMPAREARGRDESGPHGLGPDRHLRRERCMIVG